MKNWPFYLYIGLAIGAVALAIWQVVAICGADIPLWAKLYLLS